MVYFSCGNCGDTLKKAQVLPHSCRQAKFACLDCKKEFTGQESTKHVECISEAEKYSGGSFKPKPGAQKAKNKLDEWKLVLLATVEKSEMDAEQKREIVDDIQKSSLPSKLAKFQNYLGSKSISQGAKDLYIRVFQEAASALEGKTKERTANLAKPIAASNSVEEASSADSKREKKNKKRDKKNGLVELEQQSASVEGKKKKRKPGEDVEMAEEPEQTTDKKGKKNKRVKAGRENDDAEVQVEAVSADVVTSGKSKKNKKDRRGKKVEKLTEALKETHLNVNEIGDQTETTKKSKNNKRKDAVVEEQTGANDDQQSKKQKKKRKRHDSAPMDTVTQDTIQPKSKKSKKSKKDDAEELLIVNEMQTSSNEKFSITEVVKSVLENADDNQLSFKKLNKKVLAEYLSSCDGTNQMTKEKLESQLVKKLTKNPTFKYLKDKVTLVRKDD